ncbi:DUF6049 family protein [Tessaracoccus sp. OH4464_COT-324]|uniref:DUF6049 family protein n=1 Tax=Tessaracoccus sp. OH4464_COT-324 TaxID=2491059 RepID=UPI000F633218|nr:DUF6049 family protein [Tessaracoccus sp. OH4464_COT-324]RRD45790.1 hypothetical protein EII42_09980 [Tessaracoccus sp. OH4464_COT-324]
MTRAQALILLVLSALLWVGVGSARADDVRPEGLSLTTVQPQQIDPAALASKLTLGGTFVNRIGQPLHDVTVQVARATNPLNTFDELTAEIDQPTLEQTLSPEAALRSGPEPLRVDESSSFRIEIPQTELAMKSGALGAIVAIQVQARKSPDAQPEQVARLRLFIPNRARPVAPLDARLVAASPEMLPGSTNYTSVIGAAQISALLPLLKEPGTITLLDPAVHQVAQLLAARGQNDADEFLAESTKKLAAGTLWRLPTGNPNQERIPENLADLYSAAITLPPEHALSAAPAVELSASATEAKPGFDHTLRFGRFEHRTRFYRLTPEAKATQLSEVLPNAPAIGLPDPDQPWEQVGQAITDVQAATPTRDALTVAPDATPPDLRPTYLAAFSSSFAIEEQALEHLMATPAARFDPSAISLSVAPGFVMASGTREGPATITNQTSLPVYVRIGFRTDNPTRISVNETDLVRVGAGQSQTVLFRPDAKTNGATKAHAQLLTHSGKPFGEIVSFEITATAYGRLGWIVIVVALLGMGVGTVVQVRRRRATAKEPSEPGQ